MIEARLIVTLPSGKTRSFRLTNRSTRIGRGTSNDIKIPLDAVSRAHCEILLDTDAVAVRDMGSANGTQVNGETIRSQTALVNGDVIGVGPMLFVVQIDDGSVELHQSQADGSLLDDFMTSDSDDPHLGVSGDIRRLIDRD